MDLCSESFWNCPSDGIQHSGLEEVGRIYDFLAGLNLMFDVVCGPYTGLETYFLINGGLF